MVANKIFKFNIYSSFFFSKSIDPRLIFLDILQLLFNRIYNNREIIVEKWCCLKHVLCSMGYLCVLRVVFIFILLYKLYLFFFFFFIGIPQNHSYSQLVIPKYSRYKHVMMHLVKSIYTFPNIIFKGFSHLVAFYCTRLCSPYT